MPKLTRKTISIYILIVIALYIVIAVIPKVFGALTPSETIKYGTLDVSDKVTCFIVRDETVYSAAKTGNMAFKVSEGTQVKKGVTMLDFTKKTTDDSKNSTTSEYKAFKDRLGTALVPNESLLSERKGEVSFNIDGYENYFTPSRMTSFNYSDFRGMNIKPENIERKTAVEGDPIYKICDNSAWYIVYWIDKSDVSKYKVDNIVTAKLNGSKIQASVYKIIKNDSKYEIILKTNRYFKDFTKLRTINGTVTTAKGSGLEISNSCITTKNNVKGVYAQNTADKYVFKPINVLTTDGNKSIVSESIFFDKNGNSVDTVEVYDKVLKHPLKH